MTGVSGGGTAGAAAFRLGERPLAPFLLDIAAATYYHDVGILPDDRVLD